MNGESRLNTQRSVQTQALREQEKHNMVERKT
nr:MAG TPA: hypothetical protein [Caudoviricetes sp.]